MNETICETLRQVFCETFEDDQIELKPEMTSDDIEGWDSLSHVNLMMAIELRFGIEFSMKESLSFANVGALVACIERKLASRDQ